MPWPRLLGRGAAPALLYHNLGGNGVPRADFEGQMRWLQAQGAASLDLGQLAAFLAGAPLSRPSFLLTFDDGFRDLYTFVWPLLQELGFCAVVFAIANRLRPESQPGREGEIVAHAAHRAYLLDGDCSAWLSAKELRDMAQSRVFEVGSHSTAHAMAAASAPELERCPEHWAYARLATAPGPYPRLVPEWGGPCFLPQAGRMESEAEFRARLGQALGSARQELEAMLKAPVRALAWPWGAAHELGPEEAGKAGFSLAFTTRRGTLTPGSDSLALPRLEVRRNKGLGWFASRLAMYTRPGLARLYDGARL
jgi:peptidoglycan/xylan/chitin deacetylase (PgdA/CDA1 family)